jgi:hypothetical protein
LKERAVGRQVLISVQLARGAGFQAGYARFHAGIFVAQAFLPVFRKLAKISLKPNNG